MSHPVQFLPYSSTPHWISSVGYSSLERGTAGAYYDGHYYGFGDTNRGSGGDDDWFIYKMNEYGTIVWQKYIGAGNYEYGLGLDIDSSGNIYIFGAQSSELYKPFWTMQLSSSTGAIQWQRQITTGYANNVAYDLRCDSSGNVYWTGYVNSPATAGNEQMYLVKYNSSGTLQWTKTSGTGYIGMVVFVDRTTDDVYVGCGNNVSHFNSSGTLQKTVQFSTILSNSGVRGLCVDSSGNIFVSAIDSNNDGYVLKTNSSGVIQWQIKHTSTSRIYATAITLDDDGNLYVGGSLLQTSPSVVLRSFLFKYNQSNGNVSWKRSISHSTNFVQSNSHHLYVVRNSIYFVGMNQSTSGNWDHMVAKLPIDGSFTGTYGGFTLASYTTTDSTPTITSSTPSLSFGSLGSSSTSSLSISDASATQIIQYL